MQTLSVNEAKTRFGELIDRVVGVMVSAEDYQEMRAFYVDRLQRTMQATAAHAAANGLTDEKLEALLADES